MAKVYLPLIKTTAVIFLSFVIALTLMLIMLPTWLDYLRPQLMVLVLFYWVLNLPERVGIVIAWFLGIVLDVLYNVTLGEHALILVLIAYIALKWQVRINFFALWQQLVLIFILVSLYLLPQFYTGFTAESTLSIWLYWLSPLVSALIWPYLVWLLDAIRYKLNVGEVNHFTNLVVSR